MYVPPEATDRQSIVAENMTSSLFFGGVANQTIITDSIRNTSTSQTGLLSQKDHSSVGRRTESPSIRVEEVNQLELIAEDLAEPI